MNEPDAEPAMEMESAPPSVAEALSPEIVELMTAPPTLIVSAPIPPS